MSLLSMAGMANISSDKDPYWDNVVSLMTFDSSITSDITGRVWEANVQANLDTTNPKFGDGSLYVAGSPGYIRTSLDSDLYIIDSNYTIECWFNTKTVGDTRYILRGFNNNFHSSYVDGGYVLGIRNNGSTNVAFCQVGDGADSRLFGMTTIQTGQWYHLAMVLDDGTMSLFLNGIKDTQRTYNKNFMPSIYVPNLLELGRDIDVTGRQWQGYIDEFRMTRGIARYSENFTPPSKPFWHPNQ